MNMSEHNFIEEALLIPQKPVKPVEVEMLDNLITVERTYFKHGVHGDLTFPDGTQFYTLERPWLDNERRISCIPEGTYELAMHDSPLVTKLTGGDYTKAWEVQAVEGRDYVLFHQGNYVKNSAGCILLGMSKAFQGDEPVVWSSRKAFDKFMAKMNEQDDWQVCFKEAL